MQLYPILQTGEDDMRESGRHHPGRHLIVGHIGQGTNLARVPGP